MTLCKDCAFSVDISARGAMPVECRRLPAYQHKNREDWCGEGKQKATKPIGDGECLCVKCGKGFAHGATAFTDKPHEGPWYHAECEQAKPLETQLQKPKPKRKGRA